VRDLRAHGHEVHGAARRIDGDRVTVALDITDADACRRVIRGYEGVVHCAALAHVNIARGNRERCFATNAQGAENVFAAAREGGATDYVLISSVLVYGNHSLPEVVDEETRLAATDPYGAAKILAERATLEKGSPLNTTVLRMATMYAPDWLLNVRKRVTPPFIGGWLRIGVDRRSARYSLCSRDGGARVVRHALERRIAAGVYNVADDHVYTQQEILDALARLEGRRPVLPIPRGVPRAALRLVETLAPARLRETARSQYWKFCERNVYSTRRLTAAGLRLSPDLLEAGEPAPATEAR
jgi:nucleoside-diphosphate-sugar epimerase